MKLSLGAAAFAAVLAVPAVASAHPSVYESVAYTGANRDEQTRYVVANHGFTTVLQESNGLATTKGVVGYNLVPREWRTNKDFATVMAEGGTGAQAHATCVGVAALESEAAIKSWQDADAFYNYVPFQTASAGLDDVPARWLATLSNAGVDLARLASDAAAACADLGGTYTAADATQTTVAALSAGTTKPLEAKLDAATAANGALTTQVTSLSSQLDAARTQLAGMMVAATPIRLTLTSAKVRRGARLTVGGQPLKPVKVTLSIKESAARKHKLGSSLLGTATATTDAAGNAAVTVKLGKAAAKALKKLKRSLAVTAEATSGDRFATTTGKMTR